MSCTKKVTNKTTTVAASFFVKESHALHNCEVKPISTKTKKQPRSSPGTQSTKTHIKCSSSKVPIKWVFIYLFLLHQPTTTEKVFLLKNTFLKTNPRNHSKRNPSKEIPKNIPWYGKYRRNRERKARASPRYFNIKLIISYRSEKSEPTCPQRQVYGNIPTISKVTATFFIPPPYKEVGRNMESDNQTRRKPPSRYQDDLPPLLTLPYV
jgi:hypothetical protein